MIPRRKPLRRKTPVRAGGQPLPQHTTMFCAVQHMRQALASKHLDVIKEPGKFVRPITAERSDERAIYRRERLEYLQRHPFCQIFMIIYRIDERRFLASIIPGEYGRAHRARTADGREVVVPRANQIHHRNKARRGRLLDQRWWTSASGYGHNWVEANKGKARELGLLLPFQADVDGRWGAGNQALTTDELIAARAKP